MCFIFLNFAFISFIKLVDYLYTKSIQLSIGRFCVSLFLKIKLLWIKFWVVDINAFFFIFGMSTSTFSCSSAKASSCLDWSSSEIACRELSPLMNCPKMKSWVGLRAENCCFGMLLCSFRLLGWGNDQKPPFRSWLDMLALLL